MNCLRCQNLLVPEVFVDYGAGGGSMSFLGYRCVNCGDILDMTILRHRAGLLSPRRAKPRLPSSVRPVSTAQGEGGSEGLTL